MNNRTATQVYVGGKIHPCDLHTRGGGVMFTIQPFDRGRVGPVFTLFFLRCSIISPCCNSGAVGPAIGPSVDSSRLSVSATSDCIRWSSGTLPVSDRPRARAGTGPLKRRYATISSQVWTKITLNGKEVRSLTWDPALRALHADLTIVYPQCTFVAMYITSA